MRSPATAKGKIANNTTGGFSFPRHPLRGAPCRAGGDFTTAMNNRLYPPVDLLLSLRMVTTPAETKKSMGTYFLEHQKQIEELQKNIAELRMQLRAISLLN